MGRSRNSCSEHFGAHTHLEVHYLVSFLTDLDSTACHDSLPFHFQQPLRSECIPSNVATGSGSSTDNTLTLAFFLSCFPVWCVVIAADTLKPRRQNRPLRGRELIFLRRMGSQHLRGAGWFKCSAHLLLIPEN